MLLSRPFQEFTSVADNLTSMSAALYDLNPSSRHESVSSSADFLINCLTADNVLNELIKNIAEAT